MTHGAATGPVGALRRAAAGWVPRRSRLGPVLRTTAFRLTALYVSAFVLAATLAGLLLQRRVIDELSVRLLDTLTVEADTLAELGRASGTPALAGVVDERARRAPGRLYLVLDGAGARVAGNLSHWPLELTGDAGGTFRYAAAGRQNGLAAGVIRALPSGQRFVVARALDDDLALAARLRWLTFGGFGLLAAMGIAGGVLASRATRQRVARLSRSAADIMAGDMSARLAVTGDGDEFDDLAHNLNLMLDRIGELMAGLREVSDNIAHDLRTPLARLRARAEAALRAPSRSAQDLRDDLSRVIEDADDLIKTFNAMLLVARLEAGALDGTAEVFDAAALVAGIAELYEPVAEEAGVAFSCRAPGPAMVRANRQLLSQAVANLVDNAMKYGASPSGRSRVDIAVDASSGDVRITIADGGPGIPASERDRATRRFVRLEASRTKPGTGLGLSLVAAVMRLHAGAMELQDNAPGLRVVLRLPRHDGPATREDDTWRMGDLPRAYSGNA